MKQRRPLVLSLVLGFAMVIVGAAVAYAHGERSQEGFLRMQTVAFYDVNFSTDTVKQGEELTITGKVKVLDTWPNNLAQPDVGFIGVIAPGPVVLLKDRVINGAEAPDAIYIKKGDIYEFKLTVEGRAPGQWHVHPSFAVSGAGTLLGPGKWITVQDASGFSNPIQLLNGQTINLENYGLGQLVIWHWLGFFLGLGWMVYWTGPKPTVTRLPITLRIPLNTDGQDVGLITKKDHQVVNLFALATIALLVIGWIYIQAAYPVRIPQQVLRFAPPEISAPAAPAKVNPGLASYDQDSQTVVLPMTVTNTGDKPLTVKQFTTSYFTFVNQSAGATPSGEYQYPMTVDPAGPINPGETKTIKITITNPLWSDERMVEVDKPMRTVAGMLFFVDSSGAQSEVDFLADLEPKFKM